MQLSPVGILRRPSPLGGMREASLPSSPSLALAVVLSRVALEIRRRCRNLQRWRLPAWPWRLGVVAVISDDGAYLRGLGD